MAARVTEKQVTKLAELVSSHLRGELRVEHERRYGYSALDLYDGDGCVRTLSTGLTTSQAQLFLHGMVETLDIIGRPS